MAKKKSLRRALAGILAVLTVTGNMLAPTGIGKQLAETAIVAEAIDDSDFTAQKYAFDAESGTLFINGVIKTTQSNFFDDTTQNIDLGYSTTGIRNLNKNSIQHVVIMFQAVLPADSNRLFKDFKNLETVVVQTGAKFDGDDSSIAHLSSTFEGCEKLAVADLSGLTNGNRVAYIDGLFKDCPNLNYANLSSITGEMMGTGFRTQYLNLFVIDPVNEATDGDDKLAELYFADSFVYNTVNNLANAISDSMHMTPEQLLDHLLKGCANKDQLKAQLLEQYNRYEAGQNYEAPVYTWSDDHMQCTATRKHKGNGAAITETVEAEVTVTTPATCTEAGSKTYRAVFKNTTHFNPVTYTEDIPATGHSFDTFAGFVWTEDFTSAQAKFTCSHDNCDEFELYDAEVTSQTTNPTCTEDGKIVYTAVYGDYSEDQEVTLDATDHSFDTFVGFEWSEDYTSAQAKFDCSNDGCEESALYAADVTSEKQDNKTIYTATYTYTVDGAEKTETDQKTVEDEVVAHGRLDVNNSVTFAENIMLNFRAFIDDGYEEGAYVLFKYNHYGKEQTVRAEATKLKEGYMFSCPLTASELCIPVTAELYLADSEECVDSQTGSAKEYCERMIARETTKPGQKEAMIALLNYGGYVQINQNLNLDNIAYEGYQRPVNDVVIECDNEFVKPTETVGGVTYYAAALLLKDQITVKYAFTADSIEGVVFKINGKTVEAKKEGKYYVINAEPVRMRTLDTVNEVTVETAEGTISFSHSALNYAMLQAKDDPDNKLSNAMKAMYALRVAVLNMNK